MPDSIREQVVEAFTTRLGAKRGEPITSRDSLPVRSLWDLDETAEKLTMGKRRMTLNIGVGIIDRIPAGVSASQHMNALLASVLEDAVTEDPTLGGLVREIIYSGSVPDFPEPGQNTVTLEVSFELIYETRHTSPYQQ